MDYMIEKPKPTREHLVGQTAMQAFADLQNGLLTDAQMVDRIKEKIWETAK